MFDSPLGKLVVVNTGPSEITRSDELLTALPAGITIGSTTNPSGSTYRAVISGTMPTISSQTVYSFTVRATDAQGQTTDQALSITSTAGIQNSGGF